MKKLLLLLCLFVGLSAQGQTLLRNTFTTNQWLAPITQLTLPATLIFDGQRASYRTNLLSGSISIALSNLTDNQTYILDVDSTGGNGTSAITFAGQTSPGTALTNGLTTYVITRRNTSTNITIVLPEAPTVVTGTASGGGSPLSTMTIGGSFTTYVPGTIAGWDIGVDTGTATVKVWKIAGGPGGTALPTIANVINTSGLSIASGTLKISNDVSDFTTTTVNTYDTIVFAVTAVGGGVTQITIHLKITK